MPKNIFLIGVICLTIFSCKKNVINGGVNAIDTQKLEDIAKTECLPDQFLAPYLDELKIYTQAFPTPSVFAFSRGTGQCAELTNVDHGGLVSWLKIDYSDGCLLNGKLWIVESFSKSDGNNVYLNLKPANSNEAGWVRIFTNEGYSLESLRSEIGMNVFSCVSAN